MELAILLKKFREERNLTIKQLSEKSGVGNGTIGEIERGKNKARTSTLEKLAKGLNLSEEDKKKLFACLLPKSMREEVINDDPRFKDLKKKERLQYEELLNQNALFFNDESISEEDKKKMVDALTEAFYAIKKSNKRTK